MKSLVERNIEVENIKIYVTLFKLYKSYLLLISDQGDMGIGNVTLGSPSIIEGVKSPTTSYNLFGITSNLLSTIIAERASNALNAPVLLLLFLRSKMKDEKIVKPIINFLNHILEEILEKNKST
ncbi:MAG: hypothetical protein ACW96X_11280 [Promethearchaeota archaeon]|jgi:hypothetical protein